LEMVPGDCVDMGDRSAQEGRRRKGEDPTAKTTVRKLALFREQQHDTGLTLRRLLKLRISRCC
jgi:hypothetical protein